MLETKFKAIGLFCCLTSTALGCQSRPGASKTETTSSDERSVPTESAKAVASPTTIRVVNDTSETLVFTTTFGPDDPFGITRLDGPLNPTTGFGICHCKCGGDSCPEAARPATRRVTLQPSQSHDFAWNGQLTRHQIHPKTGSCCVTFIPPQGRYLFAACTEDLRCAGTEVSLPTRDVVTIAMSATSEANSCGAVNMAVAKRVARHFVTELSSSLRDRPLQSCPDVLRCVSPGDLEAQLEAGRKRPCSLFVVPRGKEIEVRVFLPIPPASVGGESYSRFSDANFTRLLRVHYEQ